MDQAPRRAPAAAPWRFGALPVAPLIALLGAACADDGSPTDGAEALADQPLLAPEALAPVPADDDPFAAHRPPEVDCPLGAWGPEGGGFEVQTGVCDHGSFDQPLGHALDAGDRLAIVVWHDRLDAPEPATGHVAVWIGNDVLWEAQAAIPGPSGVFEAELEVERAWPADALLGVHVRNHGYNSWRFVSVDRLGGGP